MCGEMIIQRFTLVNVRQIYDHYQLHAVMWFLCGGKQTENSAESVNTKQPQVLTEPEMCHVE